MSPKFKQTLESEKGDHRVYYDSKNAFSLVINKFAVKKSHLIINDSLLAWTKGKTLLEETFLSEDGKLKYNNVEVDKYSYIESSEVSKLIHSVFVFSSNSHLYKMDFSFKGCKEDKCIKEMESILESLTVDCG